jgi:hypothetical protein
VKENYLLQSKDGSFSKTPVVAIIIITGAKN